MDEKRSTPTKLRLIRGGLNPETAIAGVRIVAAAENHPPFRVDGVAVEEDTFLVLSADPGVRPVKENPIRLMTEIIKTRPQKLGSIIVREQRPLLFLAIVHDLNREPSWKEKWIAKALDEIFREIERRGLKSFALPLLGTLHGSLEKGRLALLLHETLLRAELRHLKRLWLIVPQRDTASLIRAIETGKPL